MNKFTFVIIACLFALNACKDKQSNSKVVAEENVNKMKEDKVSTEEAKSVILCFGNSLTAGFGLDEQFAWPSLMQERIDSIGLDYQVINAGLSGETTSGGLKRLDWVLQQEVDVFILELGANDMLRGLDVNSSINNLDQILLKVKERNPDTKLLLAGMLSPPNMGPDYEKSFNNMYKELSEKHNAALIPFFLEGVAGDKELNLQDGKHPNAAGQKIVLETVCKHLQALL